MARVTVHRARYIFASYQAESVRLLHDMTFGGLVWLLLCNRLHESGYSWDSLSLSRDGVHYAVLALRQGLPAPGSVSSMC